MTEQTSQTPQILQVIFPLSIELVPATSWGDNVRSRVDRAAWDILRKECYTHNNHKCEICNGQGKKHPVEAHEIWEYDDEHHIQKLTGLIALCPACHQVKHFGRAIAMGKTKEAFAHFMDVNQCEKHEATLYIRDALFKWHQRSLHEWTVDISWLEKA